MLSLHMAFWMHLCGAMVTDCAHKMLHRAHAVKTYNRLAMLLQPA